MNEEIMKIINDAVPAKYFGKPPYHAETFSTGWSCVCREDGFNCLTFKSKPGAVMTSPTIAKMIVEKWNKEAMGKSA